MARAGDVSRQATEKNATQHIIRAAADAAIPVFDIPLCNKHKRIYTFFEAK